MRADEVLDIVEQALGSHNLPWKRGSNAVLAELKKRYHGDLRKTMSVLNRVRSRIKDPEKLKILVQVAQKVHNDVTKRSEKFAGRQFASDKKEEEKE